MRIWDLHDALGKKTAFSAIGTSATLRVESLFLFFFRANLRIRLPESEIAITLKWLKEET